MTLRRFIMCVAIILFAGFSLYSSNDIRTVINLNRDWKYCRGDIKGAEKQNYVDNEWDRIGLPHSFSIPYFMSKDFYVGYGWYRKSIEFDDSDISKAVFLEFDGVFQDAQVFVNGTEVGRHVGGYTGFSLDISNNIKVGANIIAVRVNNIWRADVAPRAGEHTFSGGIYRNVRLVKKNKAYIDWYGTFVTTPDLKEHKGEKSSVLIKTDVINSGTEASNFTLRTEIIDAKGRSIAKVTSSMVIEAGKKYQFVHKTKNINSPKLWSPEHPVLYKAVSILSKNNRIIDKDITTFGFRWMEWTADKGFSLNGKWRYIRGANVHQDQAGWGDAMTDADSKRDISMVKEAGFDFIRGSHYPHSPAFSDGCDEIGVMLWSEAPFWGIGGFDVDGYWNSSAYPLDDKYKAGFEKSILAQLEEMIRIHRNHPSIVIWSMCNEVFFSNQESMENIKSLLRRMVDLSHKLDPSRLAALGGVQRPLADKRIDDIGDVAGYNGDGATQPDFQSPSVPNIVSEYGSTTSERPGEYIPGWGDLKKNDGWKGYNWRCGQAIWCAFDHGSIAGSQLGKMGIVDYFRIPKRSWYWYRNEYAKIPAPKWAEKGIPAKIKLTASKNKGVKADGTDDVFLMITVLDKEGNEISNNPSVKLTVLKGPGEFPTGKSISFEETSDIRIMDGKAAITLRSYYSGKAIIEATSKGLESARTIVEFVDGPLYDKNKDMVACRPYVRYVSEKLSEQIYGFNNPTMASSYNNGHVPGMAGDNNNGTYWEPSQNDNAPYWILDTEKGLDIKSVVIQFPKKEIYRYRIECSSDGVKYNLIKDCMDNNEPADNNVVNLDDNNHVIGRFIRIFFLSDSKSGYPALSEVRVKGVIVQ